jgi:hypothetical protein
MLQKLRQASSWLGRRGLSMLDELGAELGVKALFHEKVREQAKLVQLGFLPGASQKDEAGFGEVKDAMEAEMVADGADATMAAQIMHEFDEYLARIPNNWQAKLYRYTIMSHETLESRLSSLRRMFTIPPLIDDAKRNVIMNQTCSSQPFFMKLGDSISEKIPELWDLFSNNREEIIEWFREGGVELLEFYQDVIDPWFEGQAQRLDAEAQVMEDRVRASYGLGPRR